MLVNDEEVDVELRPAPEAAPAAEAEEPEQLSLLARLLKEARKIC